MKLSDRILELRRQKGISQEELADQLGVSRQAVSKWESDRGMPDVENLKLMSQLLAVSVDSLLAEDETISFQTVKEPISLNDYEKTGKCRDKKDADAIYPLIRKRIRSLSEKAVDLIVQPGIIQIADYLNDMSGYYLVERKGRQYLVSVSREFICTTELGRKVDPKKFDIGNHRYRKAAYRLI